MLNQTEILTDKIRTGKISNFILSVILFWTQFFISNNLFIIVYVYITNFITFEQDYRESKQDWRIEAVRWGCVILYAITVCAGAKELCELLSNIKSEVVNEI